MKTKLFIIIGVIICLVIAAGAYFHATSVMDSLYVYRSPLHNDPPVPGQALGSPLTHRVVFVLIDALRDDTSHDTAVMPFLNELRGQGAWATVHSRMPSYSDPGWTTLMVFVLLIGGVQLMLIGVLGEYLGRVYEEIKGRPLYIVAEEVGEGGADPSPGPDSGLMDGRDGAGPHGASR